MMAGEEVKCLIEIITQFLYRTKSSHYSGTKNSTKWPLQFVMLLSTNFICLSWDYKHEKSTGQFADTKEFVLLQIPLQTIH